MPSDIVTGLKGRYTESSIKTMDGQIKRLHKDLGRHTFDQSLLMDKSRIRDKIQSYDKTSVRKNILQSVLVVLKLLGISEYDLVEYTKILDDLRKSHADVYLMAESKEDLIKMAELVEMRDKARILLSEERDAVRKTNLYIRFVLLSFFTYLPPLRGQDYYNTYMVDSSDAPDVNKYYSCLEYNFYDVSKGLLVIKDHKTIKTIGERKIEVPPELKVILERWSHYNKSEYLIPTASGGKMTQPCFTEFLQNMFKPRNISVDHLRHAYVTEIVPKVDVETARKIAKVMGHSLTTQQMIYKRSEKH